MSKAATPFAAAGENSSTLILATGYPESYIGKSTASTDHSSAEKTTDCHGSLIALHKPHAGHNSKDEENENLEELLPPQPQLGVDGRLGPTATMQCQWTVPVCSRSF